MRMFLSASPLFSPPNAFVAFLLPSGEPAIAGTSWFSLEADNFRITVAVQKPKSEEDWNLPEEFGLNLLPRGFLSSVTSSFPHLREDFPLPEISRSLGNVVSGEIPYLEKSPFVFICRQGQALESYNQPLISASVTDVFIYGKRKEDFLEEFLQGHFIFDFV